MNAALKARVLAAAQTTPAMTRRQGRRRAVIAIASSITIAIALFEALGGIYVGRPLWLSGRIIEGWIFVTSIVTWLVLGRGRSTMAAAGVMCGSWATVLGLLRCPLDDSFGHVTPILLLAIIGAIAGGRMLGVHAFGKSHQRVA
jgi:hypothetical protein